MLELAKKRAAKEKAVKKASENEVVKHTPKSVTTTKPIKPTKPTKKVSRDDHEFDDWDPKSAKKVVVEEEHHHSLPVPASKITTPERLQLFINSVMKKHDDTYALSTPVAKWSNPEWSLVDVYRDDISKELLTKYAVQVEQARRILGARSGGAYSSIRDNKQLCIAHVITSWMCGDLT
jgi:hypothetical protein